MLFTANVLTLIDIHIIKKGPATDEQHRTFLRIIKYPVI